MARSSQPNSRRLAVLHRPRRQGRRRPRAGTTPTRSSATSRRGWTRPMPSSPHRAGVELPTNPDQDHDRDGRQPVSPTHRTRSPPMTRATIATDLGDIEVELYDESAPKATANFIKLAEAGLLRRRDLPPGHPGLRRPGRRRPVRQEVVAREGPGRDRRPGLQVRGRAGPGRLRPRRAGDGECRPEHERQPVLHLPPGPDRQAAQELHAVRPGDPRDGRRRQDRRGSARRQGPPERAGRDDLGDHPRATKVKEFTPGPVSKPLENGPRQGRIWVLLSQRCPSGKVMGR